MPCCRLCHSRKKSINFSRNFLDYVTVNSCYQKSGRIGTKVYKTKGKTYEYRDPERGWLGKNQTKYVVDSAKLTAVLATPLRYLQLASVDVVP